MTRADRVYDGMAKLVFDYMRGENMSYRDMEVVTGVSKSTFSRIKNRKDVSSRAFFTILFFIKSKWKMTWEEVGSYFN